MLTAEERKAAIEAAKRWPIHPNDDAWFLIPTEDGTYIPITSDMDVYSYVKRNSQYG